MRLPRTCSSVVRRRTYRRLDKKGIGGATPLASSRLFYFSTSISSVLTTRQRAKLNIVQENSFDRPWFERQHFRADFSRNLNTDSYDFDTLSMLGVYGGISYEPMAFDITDPRHPDAPVFDLSNGYFDVTTKAFARPGMIDLSSLGWGIARFPACFLPGDFSGGTAPVGKCNPIELTLRHSFRRVEDFDYEPRHWDGIKFRAYGAFDVERRGYSRNYGLTDDKWRLFISRYNIWKRSHYYENAIEMLSPVECFTLRQRHSAVTHTVTRTAMALRTNAPRSVMVPAVIRSARNVLCRTASAKFGPSFGTTRSRAICAISRAHAMQPTNGMSRCERLSERHATECRKTNSEDCDVLYPMYPGQQDMNEDLIALALEVTNCRNGMHTQRKIEACLPVISSQTRSARHAVIIPLLSISLKNQKWSCSVTAQWRRMTTCFAVRNAYPQGLQLQTVTRSTRTHGATNGSTPAPAIPPSRTCMRPA